MSENGYQARWADLLVEAVKVPGKVNACYSAFHGYSVGNCFLAAMQCAERDLPLGPIATYRGWKDKGRQVQAGEKAMYLWMPVTVNEREKDEDGDWVETGGKKMVFRLLPRWFVYAQTEGEAVAPVEVGDWSLDRALVGLDIQRVEFNLPWGNVQGFARKGGIAINPIAALPVKTAVHEIAHSILGHVPEGERLIDGETLERNLQEVEAEATALLVLDALGLPGQEFCRGYIQGWLHGEEIPEKSARRIFAAADRVLKAGTAVAEALKQAA